MKDHTPSRHRHFPSPPGAAWLLLFFVLVASGCSRQKVTELDKSTLEKDTTWSGQILVKGDIYVPPGVTLTIAPGTTVSFQKIDEKSDRNMFAVDSPYYPQAELIIRGKLIARGTAKDNIVFTTAEIKPEPSDWGAINFLGSDGNVISYAKILNAYNGVHAHGSKVEITHCEFVKNGVGVSFKAEEETPGVPWFGVRSSLIIRNNLFANNKGAIGIRNSDAEISHNEIRENKFFGIWPKEKSKLSVTYNEITANGRGIYLYQVQGATFENNNIYDNTEYNFAMAEAQDFPVPAPNNWFGTTDRKKIDETIFDLHDDAELGEVLIEPIRKEAVAWKEN
jgi:parallel beta-helix repeat protein